MSAQLNADGGRTETPTETEFKQAMTEARAAAALDGLPPGEVTIPERDYKTDTFTGTLVLFASPSTTLIRTHFNEPDAADVDGAAPGDDAPRTARTFLTDEALADPEPSADDLAFRVVAKWENSYDDERFTVAAPAPWDVPESFAGDDPNEVVKSLEWEDHHYAFDDDDRAAPPEAAEAWSLDKSAAAPLKKAAEAAGYEWVVETGDEQAGDDAGDEDALDRLAAFAEADDHVRARYEKKNGNGVGVYEGAVHSAQVAGSDDGRGYEARTTGVVFHDANDKSKRLKRDDDGTPAMFSNGHYPFMGELLSVAVVPHEARGLDDE
jgi:hypothetical protein